MSPKGSASPLASCPLTSQAHSFYWRARGSQSSSSTFRNSNPSAELRGAVALRGARGSWGGRRLRPGPPPTLFFEALAPNPGPPLCSMAALAPPGWRPLYLTPRSPSRTACARKQCPLHLKPGSPPLNSPHHNSTTLPRERPVTVDFSRCTLLKPQRKEEPPHLGSTPREGW